MTKYTDKLAEEICAKLAEGETLTSICKADKMPSERAVRGWAADPAHPFSAAYKTAREVGYHKMADELLDIADGEGQVDRDRLRVEARKWMLSKALPKLYGDKVDLKHDASSSFVEVWAAIGKQAESRSKSE